MDGSQSDASYRDEDFRSSDTDSLNGDGGTRNYGYPSAGVSDRCGGLSSPDSGSLEAARKEFNKNRKIIIKNIPPVRYEVSARLLRLKTNIELVLRAISGKNTASYLRILQDAEPEVKTDHCLY